jgi:hypothetical protein
MLAKIADLQEKLTSDVPIAIDGIPGSHRSPSCVL